MQFLYITFGLFTWKILLLLQSALGLSLAHVCCPAGGRMYSSCSCLKIGRSPRAGYPTMREAPQCGQAIG